MLATLDSCATKLGPFDPQTVTVANQLAIAYWNAGETNQAISILNRALDGIEAAAGGEHQARIHLLGTLGRIMTEEAHWEQAGVVFGEILDLCTQQYGAQHASSLAAKGDLATVLFESGKSVEAAELEREALAGAHMFLGRRHPVTCVLTWNRGLRFEREAGTRLADAMADLLWLLAEEDASLDADQKEIRAMLANRLNWGSPHAC
ncbi:MAG: tetratricopeptide repeat protein [Acidobacteriia bacterium]|nr:tetratricopeptide repeat protein [Terriglobia bacterium]